MESMLKNNFLKSIFINFYQQKMECDLATGIWIWMPMENKSMQRIFHQCPTKSANAEKEEAKKDGAN
jgi:hypothetical protein